MFVSDIQYILLSRAEYGLKIFLCYILIYSNTIYILTMFLKQNIK